MYMLPAGVLAEVRLRHVHDPQPHEAVVVRGGALHHARDKLVLPEDKLKTYLIIVVKFVEEKISRYALASTEKVEVVPLFSLNIQNKSNICRDCRAAAQLGQARLIF